MDGFCLQGELDLTLFYMIEGYFDNLKSLMTGNDRNLWGLKMKMTLNDFDPRRRSGRYSASSRRFLNS